MDASILSSLLAKALELEKELKIQDYLDQARDAVSNMASTPQEPAYQTAFAEALTNLKESLAKLALLLTPAEWDRLEEISCRDEFSNYLIDQIEKVIAENAATPAVIRDKIVALSKERSQEIDHMKTLYNELEYLGFEPDENEIDEGQVGFKIPREIFSNNLTGLITELNFLRKFVRLISEAEGENPDHIEVGTISTSDPLVWLIVAYGVAKTVGGVTDWCLDTWKKVEDIRHVRAQTAQLNSFKPQEIEEIFGPKIETEIESEIEEKLEDLLRGVSDQSRKHELRNGLRPALRQFLARVERGLTVDVRYLPVTNPDNDGDGPKEDIVARSDEMHSVAAKLVFPRPFGNPVLQIEAANDDDNRPKPTRPGKLK